VLLKCVTDCVLTSAQVTERIAKYFTENPSATVFAGDFDVQGDRTIMKAAIDYGNKNNKAIYIFSVDTAKGQVAHQNYVPKELVKSKKLDAKTWLGEVSKLVGGKVGTWSGYAVSKKLTLQCDRAVVRMTAPWDPATMSTRWTKPSSERSSSTVKRPGKTLQLSPRVSTSCRAV
jgi:hypothetical protein